MYVCIEWRPGPQTFQFTPMGGFFPPHTLISKAYTMRNHGEQTVESKSPSIPLPWILGNQQYYLVAWSQQFLAKPANLTNKSPLPSVMSRVEQTDVTR